MPRLDRVGRLPVADGVTAVGLPLTMACFGVHSDVPAALTCDGTSGALAAEPVLSSDDLALPVSGSWTPATPIPCPEAAPLGMVCVPGGALLLGGSGIVVASVELRPQPEQLVQVAPFAMDLEEVTVGQLYELRRDGRVIGAPALHDPDPKAAAHMCAYLEDDRSNDTLPVNCIEHGLASAACVAMGKRLPSEAEWEWAAGNGPLETTYPWGSEDLDLCDRAVVGFGRTASETSGQDTSESSECRQGGADVAGPRVGGSDNERPWLGPCPCGRAS